MDADKKTFTSKNKRLEVYLCDTEEGRKFISIRKDKIFYVSLTLEEYNELMEGGKNGKS
jgi:hypothetical protein